MESIAETKVMRPGRLGVATSRMWPVSGLSTPEIASRATFLGMAVVILVTSIICAALAISWIDKPFAGFLVNQRMVLPNMGRYHWTGTQAGLQFPDKVLKANGQLTPSMKDLERVIRQGRVGDPVTYSIERKGQVIEL